MLPLDVVLNVGGLVLTAVVLVLGMKFSLNGMREDVSEIKVDVRALVVSDAGQNERLGRLEERIESHAGWIGRVERRREERE